MIPPYLTCYMFINAKMDIDTIVRALTGCRPGDLDYATYEGQVTNVLRQELIAQERRRAGLALARRRYTEAV